MVRMTWLLPPCSMLSDTYLASARPPTPSKPASHCLRCPRRPRPTFCLGCGMSRVSCSTSSTPSCPSSRPDLADLPSYGRQLHRSTSPPLWACCMFTAPANHGQAHVAQVAANVVAAFCGHLPIHWPRLNLLDPRCVCMREWLRCSRSSLCPSDAETCMRWRA
ncbi:hypothetical protein C8Q76DRAFT_710147 [Earliella scabrosa]|nr:hypothetical protein C8Q76DRAFT_710147 [Earliella scabrosa]